MRLIVIEAPENYCINSIEFTCKTDKNNIQMDMYICPLIVRKSSPFSRMYSRVTGLV